MSNDLVDVMKKIISIDELKKFTVVEEKLAENGEAYIFQNNKPTHVIMTIKKYERLTVDAKKQDVSDISSVNLETLLNKIGKKIFVDYYDVFKSDNNPEQALEKEGFTLASRRSRSSSARSIFKNNLQIEALNNIIASIRMDMGTIKRAQDLLSEEYQYVSNISKESKAGEEKQYHVKIGKMMRGILTILLQNNFITENELIQMQNMDYSKAMFNLNFPVLKRVFSKENLDQVKRDSNGYNRYYDTAVLVNGQHYLICSQWIESLHRSQAEQWIADKMMEVADRLVSNIPVGISFSIQEILSDYWIYIDWSIRSHINLKYKNLAKTYSNIELVSEKEYDLIYRKVR